MEQQIQNPDVTSEKPEAVPVCLHCFEPVDPLEYYCPNCGGVTGQFTEYIPFVNIQWSAGLYGNLWRQLWAKEVSLWGRLLRLGIILWFVPILLLGLFFKSSRSRELKQTE